MNLFAVVFTDDLAEHGRSIGYFNVRTPNVNFKHYAVPQKGRGAQAGTIARLLAEVRQDYPHARDEDAERAVWIVRE